MGGGEKDCFRQNLRTERKGILSGLGKTTAIDPSRQDGDDDKQVSLNKSATRKKRKVVNDKLQKTSAQKLKRRTSTLSPRQSSAASSESESTGGDNGAVERNKPQVSKEDSITAGLLRSSDRSMRGYPSLLPQRGVTLLDNSNLLRNANRFPPSHFNFWHSMRSKQQLPPSGSQPFASLHGSRLDPDHTRLQAAAGYYQEAPVLRGIMHGDFSGRNAAQPPKNDMLGVGRTYAGIVVGSPNLLQQGVQVHTCGSNQFIEGFLLGRNQRRDLDFFVSQSSSATRAVHPFLLQPSMYIPAASLRRTPPGLRSSNPHAAVAPSLQLQGEELRMPMPYPSSHHQHPHCSSLLQHCSSRKSYPLSSERLSPRRVRRVDADPPIAAGQYGPQPGRCPTLNMDCDDLCLSKFQCLARKQIELFEATSDDVEAGARGRNHPIVLGQVGIRCRHCSQLPPHSPRTRGAVYFPSKLERVYQTAVNMASLHLCKHCQHIPQNIRDELLRLKDKKSNAGGGKDYWGSGIRMMGAVEAEDCLRFTEAGRNKEMLRRQQQGRSTHSY
jgi:hypothetical protein